ncbi:WhiB family transcriptional regulator [Streptomyces sp. SCSIO-PteL053]|nr:WhiB family transcriptional regulator [Streptomyces sp. SCSIO-PteL053]
MDSLHFLADREQELRDLIQSPEDRDSVRAACRDVDVSLYHPEDGERPADGPLAVCVGCEGRLECLALALRAEDPEARHGWYGGLGPADRDRIAAMLRLATVATPPRTGLSRPSVWAETDGGSTTSRKCLVVPDEPCSATSVP